MKIPYHLWDRRFYKKMHIHMRSYTLICQIIKITTAWKVSKYVVFSGQYYPKFELNTERYEVSLMQAVIRGISECRKKRTRKNSISGQFSRVRLFKVLQSDRGKFPNDAFADRMIMPFKVFSYTFPTFSVMIRTILLLSTCKFIFSWRCLLFQPFVDAHS